MFNIDENKMSDNADVLAFVLNIYFGVEFKIILLTFVKALIIIVWIPKYFLRSFTNEKVIRNSFGSCYTFLHRSL